MSENIRGISSQHIVIDDDKAILSGLPEQTYRVPMQQFKHRPAVGTVVTMNGKNIGVVQSVDDEGITLKASGILMQNSGMIGPVSVEVDADKQAIDHQKRFTFNQVMSRMSPIHVARHQTIEQIVEAFFHKLGGIPSEDSVVRLMEYLNEQEKLVYTKLTLPQQLHYIEPSKPDDFLNDLVEELEDIAGVTGVQPLLNDYPEKASIILKMDTHMLSENEAMTSMTAIQEIIKRLKPKGLDCLEVIYHTREVYE